MRRFDRRMGFAAVPEAAGDGLRGGKRERDELRGKVTFKAVADKRGVLRLAVELALVVIIVAGTGSLWFGLLGVAIGALELAQIFGCKYVIEGEKLTLYNSFLPSSCPVSAISGITLFGRRRRGMTLKEIIRPKTYTVGPEHGACMTLAVDQKALKGWKSVTLAPAEPEAMTEHLKALNPAIRIERE